MIAMPRKKKPDSEGGDRHRNRAMGFRPSDELREAIEALAKKERRRPAQMALILIEDALAARGLWPPTDQEGGK